MLLTLARLVTASLLIASAAAFATGATIERQTASSESRPSQQDAQAGKRPSVDTPGEHRGSAEPASRSDRGQPEAGPEDSARHAAARAAEQNSENLLGINPEATGLVIVAVALSLLLAALILTVGSPLLAVGVALAMMAFTALDVRELTHQLHESRAGLAALAATVAVLHLAAGAVQAHQVAADAEHALIHVIPRLTAALVHADPQPHDGAGHHTALTGYPGADAANPARRVPRFPGFSRNVTCWPPWLA